MALSRALTLWALLVVALAARNASEGDSCTLSGSLAPSFDKWDSTVLTEGGFPTNATAAKSHRSRSSSFTAHASLTGGSFLAPTSTAVESRLIFVRRMRKVLRSRKRIHPSELPPLALLV